MSAYDLNKINIEERERMCSILDRYGFENYKRMNSNKTRSSCRNESMFTYVLEKKLK